MLRLARLTVTLVVLAAAVDVAAQDTFSIVAVDPATQQVGSAGASCIAGSIIISDMHPGVGAIHTQSFYNSQNQNFARLLMDAGTPPQEIIDLLVANDAQGNPSIRQYGVVDLVNGGRSAAFTGVNCFDYKSDLTAPTYAIAGNILLGQSVLDDMETAFNTTPGFLADKLMAALQGANVPGADTRCLGDGKPAISAFIRVANAGDTNNDLYLDLNVNNTSGSENPIDLLQVLYDDWRATTGVGDAPAPYVATQLFAARPNPFRADTAITIRLAENGPVTLQVYDVAGRRVRTLADEVLAAGVHARSWDGDDTQGYPVASGVYFYQLVTPDRVATRKVMRAR